ncbi:Putative uncharacterized protein [Pararhodospirillum photometricum DSM 122]|uniref:Membrane transporter protein n=1 Tax=Pararhodospirillum photometricum DSM 122 TaxID=1150469 RepID=H6SPX3_PARPM|nr:Putative uncharacterized protein [Pararhodospirillum photometricum DSM 122]
MFPPSPWPAFWLGAIACRGRGRGVGGGALALVPALAGMMMGVRLRRLASKVTFRRLFFGGLLVLGGAMLLSAVVV